MRIGLACAILVAISSTTFAEDRPPSAQPAKTRQPFQDAEKHDLKGFGIGFVRGDLGGKKLKEIVTEETTTRVIVLANNTSAPNGIHLGRVARLIESNPTIKTMWTKDKTSGERKWDTSYNNLTPFFAVLLEGKNGRITGLLFFGGHKGDKKEMVKVVSEVGVGVVRIVADEKKSGAEPKTTKSATSTDQPKGPLTAALQPPIKLDELLVWRDGGSLGFKLSDAAQRHVAFCVDGRFGSSTRGCFFLNVTHATQNGGRRLDLGGDTEKTLIFYLKSWLAASFKPEQLTAILKIEDFSKLSKDEFKARHVLRLVESRAKVIRHIKEQAGQNPPSRQTKESGD